MKARFFAPMLRLAVPKLPEGPEWHLELKLDSYREIGIKSNGRAHLASRSGRISANYSRQSASLRSSADETVIDGEIVAVNEDGLPWFNLLQNFGGTEHTTLFYAFDLLILAHTERKACALLDGQCP